MYFHSVITYITIKVLKSELCTKDDLCWQVTKERSYFSRFIKNQDCTYQVKYENFWCNDEAEFPNKRMWETGTKYSHCLDVHSESFNNILQARV